MLDTVCLHYIVRCDTHYIKSQSLPISLMQSGLKLTFDIFVATTGLACLKYAAAVLIDDIGSFDIKSLRKSALRGFFRCWLNYF